MNKRTSPILFTAVALALLSSQAHADSSSWVGTTDAQWSDLTNWSGGAAVPGTTDTATFNTAAGAGGSVIDLGGAVTVQTLAFDTAAVAAYTIGTGAVGTDTLTLDNDGSITVGADVVADQTINANVVLGNTATASTYTFTNASATNSLSVAGNITGGAAAAKTLAVTGAGATNLSGIISDGSATSLAITSSDAGTLTLSGVNTYSGGTTINAGSTILADNNLALGSGTVTLTDTNATLALGDGVNIVNALTVANLGNAKTITVAGTTAEYSGNITNSEYSKAFNLNATSGKTLTVSGVISGNGTGALTLNGSGTVILSGNNTFARNVSLTANNATLRLENSNAAGDGTGTIQMRATTTVELADGVTLANNFITTTGGGVKRILLDTGATAEVTGNINQVETGGFSLNAQDSSQLTISGNLTGTQWFNVNGTGDVILSGANTHAGNLTFSGDGSLTLADGGSMTFFIEDAGVNNGITGNSVGGLLNLDGSFIFDLTGASTTVGDSWMVVDGTFTETYGNTFAVDSTVGSFTDLGGDVWGIVENGVGYEFSELTGELSVVVPEPSTYALLAGLLGLSYAMVRRRR
ncbi:MULTISPECIES: autotransporter-associated beta strand repeat-containing protein [unclassified Lentimonas]|uniref:beta strand repeat-containing protein n=1 Tax=unclassified Lentimonas TaxID=2630993 RepID=UPI00132149AF|nr:MULTISPECIES: autotransporter-associated beta strand repeat-containing protein [unclassified Lentimonas]CAA6691589.1 Unannotated [Lentimonas sp. CC19]CAA6692226.1 Unannotated [Lentimonas sp. CC10]CAA7070168.1 Unannotated [Lentimonas sp. CC11]